MTFRCFVVSERDAGESGYSPTGRDVDNPIRRGDDEAGVNAWEVNVDEYLTMEEIEARYAPDWVLIGALETDENLSVRGGCVLFHGPDHDEVCRKAGEHMPGRFAVLYLGTWPEDMVLVL